MPSRPSPKKRSTQPLPWRGFLLHMTHYDPVWNKQKDTERRYDKPTARAVIRAMADAGLNLLLIDVKDAVIYRGLPDIKRRYTAPMAELVELADYARSLGLEVVPKMNFSRSPQHRHSAWLEPNQRLADDPKFWRRGLAAVDEVVNATGARIVHVGMDEDDTRSPAEYQAALHRLYRELKKRKLQMAIWADLGHPWRPQQRWKEEPAIRSLPRDIIVMPWSYSSAQEEWTPKLKRMGFTVLGACGYDGSAKRGPDPLNNAREWVKAIRACKADGVVLTRWIKCSRKNRADLIEAVEQVGRVLTGRPRN